MGAGKSGLTLHQMALAVTMSMVKDAQEKGMWFSQQGFLTEDAVAEARPVKELLILYLNLWAWYEAKNKLKIEFWDDLLFWMHDWLGRAEGVDLTEKEVGDFFVLLEKRSAEYLTLQKTGLGNEKSRMKFATQVLLNMGGEGDDPLPVMLVWNHIEYFMKYVRDTWECVRGQCK